MTRTEYFKKRENLLTEAQECINSGDLDGYNAKENEIKELDNTFEATATAQANMAALQNLVPNVQNTPAGAPIQAEVNNAIAKREDRFNTLEYREAFMEYCQTGVIGTELMNVDAQTTTTDASAMIPTTILDEIIKEMEAYGQIFSMVRKLNIQGGVEVPILSLKPTATWITEATPSDRKKVTANTNVSFTYFGLECKVAVSLLADTVTLASFEKTIKVVIVEAMVKAIDTAIIKGTGSGQPLGITVDSRIPGANIITLSAADFITWNGWKKKVFAKIPLAYRAGGVFTMAAGTFDGYIDGMVDANGQPIARVNYGITDAAVQRFGGRPVILVEDDVIAPYDTASTNDIVAIFCKYSDYALNSNMQMRMFRWLDQDTNQWVDKAILIADGKILDPNGVIIIKKGA